MKNILYILFAAVLFYSCTSTEDEPEFTTGKIQGSVVINGEPVNAAAILLTPGGGTKITGSDGYYNFSDLQPGRYELKVYKEGTQNFNKSIEIVAGKEEELAITLTKSTGKLSVNKAYIDMGSNESNNVAGFSILNEDDSELTWQITNAAGWIKKIDPQSGTVNANSAEAVVFTIDRNKLSANLEDNHASLVIRSTTAGDGSTAELLVTVFGIGDGTNTTIDNDADYIVIGDLYVQTKDISSGIDWTSANSLCQNSIVGGYNDWRLPDIDELAILYNNREAIGGFNDNCFYWSETTGYDYTYSKGIHFSNGSQSNQRKTAGYINYTAINARAVRKNVSPKVTISPASNISENSVTFNGEIAVAGTPAYTERGFVYGTAHLPTIEDTKVISYTSKSSDTFTETVTGLTMGTTYYVRAYATNSISTAYSEEITLTISNMLPEISTLPVTDIAETSVVLHGCIDSKGIPAYTERGFVYSTTFQNPTIDNDKQIVSGTGIGNFSKNLSGLTTGKTYYVRAYATNSEGTAYGTSISFKPESPHYVILETAKLMVQKEDITSSSINWTSAKSLCENSTIGGYTDWRIPTLNELSTMYSNRNIIGKFDTSYSSRYWSSTASSINYYYFIYFSDGSQGSNYYSYSYHHCRCVRSLP